MTAPAAGANAAASRVAPILLFDDECAVCRRMASWVSRVARSSAGEPTIDVRAIGEDPEALRRLDPRLDIWKVYAKSHLLMPDGVILIAGEAVAEVLRRSPGMAWCAWLFALRVFNDQVSRMFFKIDGKRIEFERSVKEVHRQLRTGFLRWLVTHGL